MRGAAGRLETVQDVADARARLERRSAQTLAAFIVSLAHDEGPAGEQVRTFIVGDDLEATIGSVRARIMALGASDSGEARDLAGEAVGRRLEYLLEAIETLVLPVDVERAFELLVELFARDGDAMEGCGDHHDHVANAFEWAVDLIAVAARGLPREEVLVELQRLVANDDYGTRRRLTAVVVEIGVGQTERG
jgi:hypothetical protein